jgi:hypothetical protein
MMLSSDLSGKRDCDLRDVYLSAEVFVGKLRRAGGRTEDSCGNFIQRTIRAQLGQARKQNGISGREFRQFALGVTNGFFSRLESDRRTLSDRIQAETNFAKVSGLVLPQDKVYRVRRSAGLIILMWIL